MNLLKRILNNVACLFFPNPCVNCGKVAGINKFLCRRCKDKPIYIGRYSVCRTCYEPLDKTLSFCPKCLSNKPKYDRLIACVNYSGGIKRMLTRFKFYDRPDFCDSFALMIYKRLLFLEQTDFDVIIPIPMSKERFLSRGYNQSELIARRLSELLGVPLETEVLLKVKNTERQSRLPMDKREANIRGAFALYNKERIFQKRVLLIDDIVTTGATMREASRVLSKTTYSITACAVAKTVLNRTKF